MKKLSDNELSELTSYVANWFTTRSLLTSDEKLILSLRTQINIPVKVEIEPSVISDETLSQNVSVLFASPILTTRAKNILLEKSYLTLGVLARLLQDAKFNSLPFSRCDDVITANILDSLASFGISFQSPVGPAGPLELEVLKALKMGIFIHWMGFQHYNREGELTSEWQSIGSLYLGQDYVESFERLSRKFDAEQIRHIKLMFKSELEVMGLPPLPQV